MDTDKLRESIIETLKTVFDPEIPVNIYDMGMIYGIEIMETGHVFIKMTLTSPACPVAGILPGEAEQRVAAVDGVEKVSVELVWDPPWTPDKLSEAARLQLGLQ